MAKKAVVEVPEVPRILDFEDVANILDFLAWHEPGGGGATEEHANNIEAGRTALLLQLADNLRYANYARCDEMNEVMAANKKLREALEVKEAAHG